jgi:hypothetical protein
MRSGAATVAEYLRGLEPDRRSTLTAVRKVVRANLPSGYEERMNWGMISYEIPLSRYPQTYNGQPLSFAALASQKHYCVLHLMFAYQDSAATKQIADGARRAGKKLDIGRACIRFRTAADLPLDVIAEVIRSTPPQTFIAQFEASRHEVKGAKTQ